MTSQTIPAEAVEAEVLVEQGGVWFHAKPMRDTSWWHQWKRQSACRGHEWHPETAMGADWFCCKCGRETDRPTP